MNVHHAYHTIHTKEKFSTALGIIYTLQKAPSQDNFECQQIPTLRVLTRALREAAPGGSGQNDRGELALSGMAET